MITGLLAIFIEVFTANQLIQHVADYLASRLVGAGLPAPLQTIIAGIIKTKEVRENHEQAFRFSIRSDHKVDVEVSLSYDVKNYSHLNVDYAPFIAQETFHDPQFLYLEYGISGQKTHVFDAKSLAGLTTTESETRVKTVRNLQTVSIPPIKRNPDACCKVTWQYRLTMPEEYTELTSFAGATVGTTIRLVEIPEELDFIVSGGPDVEHCEGGKTWRFNRSFIEGQHVRYWWFKRSSSVSNREASEKK
jgi:hypothetical protein